MTPEEQPDGASTKWVMAFGCYLIVLNLALLYLLIKLWPGIVPLKDDYNSLRLLPGLPEIKIWKETRSARSLRESLQDGQAPAG